MYEAVTPHPAGESTVARAAATAADYGYEGLVVRDRVDVGADYDGEAIEATHGIDVVSGLEVRVDDPSRASGYVGTYRPRTTILILRGESTALNRFAVNQERVDVLADPMSGGDVNHVLVRAAKEHGVRLEVNLGRALRTSGGRRVRALSGLRKLRELIDAYDAPFVVSGDPATHLALRSPRDLRAVGEIIGFEPGAIDAGLAEWGRIAAENRERMSPSYVAPGVRLGGEDDADGAAGEVESADGTGGEDR